MQAGGVGVTKGKQEGGVTKGKLEGGGLTKGKQTSREQAGVTKPQVGRQRRKLCRLTDVGSKHASRGDEKQADVARLREGSRKARKQRRGE